MHVYLLRHGIADDHGPGGDDRKRALTEEGWRRLRAAARSWKRAVPNCTTVFTSPLRRAVETAKAFADAIGYRGEATETAVLESQADPADALRLVTEEQHSGTPSIALVGHEPHLGHLLGLLTTGRQHAPIPLKKGMLVGLELESSASRIATLRFALSARVAEDLG